MTRALALHDPEWGPLTDDRLTRDLWLWQRAKGHRFSSDDLVTALVAFESVRSPRRIVDLGTGIGTVLLHLSWCWREAHLWGVEAQRVSYELLRRNIDRSGYAHRLVAIHEDLRSTGWRQNLLATMDLVTGTPPYFPTDAALSAMDEQRAYARIEYRGGVEAYVEAGDALLAPDGKMVLCGDAHAEDRVARSAERAGLFIVARCSIIARAGAEPLFAVWTLQRGAASCAMRSLTLRDASGKRTEDARKLRAFSGL